MRHAYSVRGPGSTLPCASGAYAGSLVAGTHTPRGPSCACQHCGRADLLVLFIELDAGLGRLERLRHLLLRVAQAGHNAHAGHDDSSVALPRTVARHETGTPDKHGGSRFEHPFWRTTPICSCVDLGVVWLALRDTDAGEGDTSRPTTLEAASSNATMLASVRGAPRRVDTKF